MLIAAPKPRLVTRQIGDLSSIHDGDTRMVIWTRNLPVQIRTELRELASSGIQSSVFITLATDPIERVRHQLSKSEIRSAFLDCDISMLVMAFADLTKSERIKVSLDARTDNFTGTFPQRGEGELLLACAYTSDGLRPAGQRPLRTREAGGHVTVMRRDSSFRNEDTFSSTAAAGLYLQLETAPSRPALS